MNNGRRQPSRGGTSRMMREYQVRICERLGVKFPGPTRQRRLNPEDTAYRRSASNGKGPRSASTFRVAPAATLPLGCPQHWSKLRQPKLKHGH